MAVYKVNHDLAKAIRSAWEFTGLLNSLTKSTRVALKPNLTYPYYKKGVTTSPEVIRAAVRILKEFTPHIAIVETDGGYGSWKARDAFEGHQLFELQKEFDVDVVNLCEEEREPIRFLSRGMMHEVPLPTRLLYNTDLFISLPVPKIHAMTGLTLAYKNQWGCIPDNMRLRRHYVFDDAIVAINRALKPHVLADGTIFLDRNGPMEGVPVKMDLIIAATDAGAFDRYVSELMGYSWERVRHHRRAVALGDMPKYLQEIDSNVAPGEVSGHVFTLDRTWRHYIALAGFKSRFLTWFGYESWFGRVVLHAVLYAIVGKPVKPKPGGRPESE